MQLILETENTSIGLEETMSSLEKDVVAAIKNIENDINNVPNGNKVNIQDQENIEEKNLDEDKQITQEITAVTSNGERTNEESSSNEESEEKNLDQDKQITPEITAVTTNGETNNEESSSNEQSEEKNLDEDKQITPEITAVTTNAETNNEESSSNEESPKLEKKAEDLNENCEFETEQSEEKQTLCDENGSEVKNNSKNVNNSEILNDCKSNEQIDSVTCPETVLADSYCVNSVRNIEALCEDKQTENMVCVSEVTEKKSSHTEVKDLLDDKIQNCKDTVVESTKDTCVSTSTEQEITAIEKSSEQQIRSIDSNSDDTIKSVQLVSSPVNQTETKEDTAENKETLNAKLEHIINETESDISKEKDSKLESEKSSDVEPMECEDSNLTTEAKNVENNSKTASKKLDLNRSVVTEDEFEQKKSCEKLNGYIVANAKENSNESEIPMLSETVMESTDTSNLNKNETEFTKNDTLSKTAEHDIPRSEMPNVELNKDSINNFEFMDTTNSTEHNSGNIETDDKSHPSVLENVELEKTSTKSSENLTTDISPSNKLQSSEDKIEKVTEDIKTQTIKDKSNGDDVLVIEEEKVVNNGISESKKSPFKPNSSLKLKLSNTLNILSDDEDEPSTVEAKSPVKPSTPTQETQNLKSSLEKVSEKSKNIKETDDKDCINLDDDDDIMLIDEDSTTSETNAVKQNDEQVSKVNNENIMVIDEDITATEKNIEKQNDEKVSKLNERNIMVIDKNITATEKNIEKQNDETANKQNDTNVMVIEEDTPPANNIDTMKDETTTKASEEKIEKTTDKTVVENKEVEEPKICEKEPAAVEILELPIEKSENADIKESPVETETKKVVKRSPLLPDNLFKNYRKNLSDMTRDELEEFCILKIVESIIDRSDLNEIRTKLKTMAQNIEEYKKKAMVLMKQNRDLKVILTSVQEEQKKGSDHSITPLKITRSVGMQVLMTDKVVRKRGPQPGAGSAASRAAAKQIQKQQTQANTSNQQIPVPRLVPAAPNPTVPRMPVTNQSPAKIQPKPSSPMSNSVKISPPVAKPEKRTHNKMMTVDLTDDEPPLKVPAKIPASPPVRLVPSQNLMAAPRQQIPQNINSPRKVYIPISTPQSVRPGTPQTIMVKTVPSPGARPRGPINPMVRIPQSSVRMGRAHNGRHPAPLPDVVKQYQSPNWKALPPAPDLKLSKVENGIVISWKIEGYQEDSYEEIASYQLYAYQETSAPPNTALWKKIGDVKALPLPMACTLTQFMAGYKYYFAVRAVDVKSRLGPFSLPGSILLLNKM